MNYSERKSVITADIIGSTELSILEKDALIIHLEHHLSLLDAQFNMRSELFRGDSFQCLLYSAKDALRVLLLLKSIVRGFVLENIQGLSASVPLDVRLSLGIGEVNAERSKVIVSDGSAFYFSGRNLDNMKENKQTIAIKSNDIHNLELETEFKLLDFILSKSTVSQCQVMYLKLQGKTEKEIAKALKVTQSAVNQRSNAIGWNTINFLINRYESIYAH